MCFCIYTDFEKIFKRCKEKPLEGKYLVVEQVPLCNCVLVTGLSTSTSRETISNYFENPAKGGGNIETLQCFDTSGAALIYYEKPKGWCLVFLSV